MNIVQVLPELFQEYENEVSLGLACANCQFKCTYCHMQGLIYDPTKVLGKARDLFFKHVNPMHTAVVITGGEPTLWANTLYDLLVIIKSQGLKTKVFSNAFNFEVIYTLNQYHLVDEYSFDVKAARDVSQVIGIPISDEKYLEHLFATLSNCKRQSVPFELRHTMAPGIDLLSVKALLFGAEKEGIKVHYQECVQYESAKEFAER